MRVLEAPLPKPGAHTVARIHAGEIPDPGVDADRLAELEAERRAFLTSRPTSAFTAAIEARRNQQSDLRSRLRNRLRFGGVFTFAVAAAASAVFFVGPPEPTEVATTRLKAGVGLSFHVRSGDQVQDGQPGGAYHPGDAIQLRYTSGVHEHLLILSLDATGAVTPFYDQDGRSLSVAPGVAQLLEGSVVLDDALGPEVIFGCFSEAPLDTDAVAAAGRAALQEAGGDPSRVERLDVDCVQARLLIHKAPRPAD